MGFFNRSLKNNNNNNNSNDIDYTLLYKKTENDRKLKEEQNKLKNSLISELEGHIEPKHILYSTVDSLKKMKDDLISKNIIKSKTPTGLASSVDAQNQDKQPEGLSVDYKTKLESLKNALNNLTPPVEPDKSNTEDNKTVSQNGNIELQTEESKNPRIVLQNSESNIENNKKDFLDIQKDSKERIEDPVEDDTDQSLKTPQPKFKTPFQDDESKNKQQKTAESNIEDRKETETQPKQHSLSSIIHKNNIDNDDSDVPKYYTNYLYPNSNGAYSINVTSSDYKNHLINMR